MMARTRLLALVVAAAALALACTVRADEFGSTSHVTVLTMDNFDRLVGDSLWMVKFYAPWCGHCKRIAPMFEAAAREAGHIVSFGEVDATSETFLKDKYNVKGYPTILFFRDSKQYEYTHARTTEGFIDFVKRMTGPAVKSLTTIAAVEDFVTKSGVAFVFVPPEEGFGSVMKEQSVFKSVAVELQALHYFGECRTNKYNRQHAGKAFPLVAKLEDGEAPVYYDGPWEEQALQAWVVDNQFPVVSEISQVNFGPLSKSGRLMAVAIVDPKGLGTKGFLDSFRNIARGKGIPEPVWDKYNFVTLDGIQWEEFIAQYDVYPSQLPRVVVLNGEAKSFFEEGISRIVDVPNFLVRVAKGEVPEQYEGFWGYPQRAARIFTKWMPHSAIALVAALAVMIYGCCFMGGPDAPNKDD